MNTITGPRKVVIDHCRKRYTLSMVKRSPEGFCEVLWRIHERAVENNGILTSEQAWLIAEETWSFATKRIDPKMAAAFSCLSMPPEFEDMSDVERVEELLGSVSALDMFGRSFHSRLCAHILSMGIRIATDASLASSPEIFQEG